MIQRITKNSDIKFCVSDDSKIQDKFIIKFYTIDKSKAIIRTADDVITEKEKRYIKLNWTSLKLLDNGILNYEVNNLDADADYNDGVYNSTFTRTTYYYIYTDSNCIDAVEEISSRVDQIAVDLTKEKNDREDADNDIIISINALTDRLNEEITRAKASEKSNTDKINTETNDRKKADTSLTDTTNKIDARVKTLENQTVWDFGTY